MVSYMVSMMSYMVSMVSYMVSMVRYMMSYMVSMVRYMVSMVRYMMSMVSMVSMVSMASGTQDARTLAYLPPATPNCACDLGMVSMLRVARMVTAAPNGRLPRIVPASRRTPRGG